MAADVVKIPLRVNAAMLALNHIIVIKMKKTILSSAIIAACLLALPVHAQSYGGYPCTDDCSGHEAGYDWAEDNSIQDESDCGGNSNSFIEGCYSYVEEQEDEAERERSWNDDEEDDQW